MKFKKLAVSTGIVATILASGATLSLSAFLFFLTAFGMPVDVSIDIVSKFVHSSYSTLTRTN
tara:strand:+ start:2211 stop:2396 length:186 start_codon:yes stop_codon:yes gene_type:complete